MVCCASKVMQSESANNKNIDRQEHQKALTQQYNYKTKRTKIYFSCPTHDHKHPTRLGAYGSNACRHNRRPTPQPSSPQLLCTSAAPPTHPDLAPTHTHAATPASSHPPDKLEDLQPRVPGTLTPRSGRVRQGTAASATAPMCAGNGHRHYPTWFSFTPQGVESP